MLRLKLFGQVELSGPDGQISLSSSKLNGLLAYLALSAKPVPREELASLLWGSHFDEQARQNFRQALVRLRRAAGADAIIANDQTIQLSPSGVECDAQRFEQLARSGSPDDLKAAVELLDGEFLAGTVIREAGWEEWLANQRRHFDRLACDTLLKLGTAELEQGDCAMALERAEALIRRDYFREDAHRLAIKTLIESGRRAEAVRHYQQLAGRLKAELNTTPEPATAAILDQQVAPAPIPAAPAVPAAQAKPSIAVMPFANLSNDPEQDYFAEGISEDIITEISKFRSLFVISRNSTFSFRNQVARPRDVSAQLGARYIVEGSVRRMGNRIRITAQLIDAPADAHLWAEHFDRDVTDIFKVQDEVVAAIVLKIEPQLLNSERNRALRKPPENLDVWENYQRALWHMFRYNREERDTVYAFFNRAIALDPSFAPAYAGLSYAYYVSILLGSSPDRAGDLDRAFAAARMAASLDQYDPFAYVSLARYYLQVGNGEAALEAADRSIALNPSSALAHFGRGHALWHQGRPEEALPSIDEAMRLSPNDTILWSFMASKAIALFLAGHCDEALACSRRAQQQNNAQIFAHVGELCALGFENRKAEAADAVARARKTMPDASVTHLGTVLPITDEPTRARFLKGLRQSGLPE